MEPLKFDSNGLVVAVAQDRLTGQVRMVAWMNQAAVDRTLETGLATFYSRSRGKLWQKGESSGHLLRVHSVWTDCDGDTLLLSVDPVGPSCHTGEKSCFFRRLDTAEAERPCEPFLPLLEAELETRKASSGQKSYTRALLDGGAPKIGAKLLEEAGELGSALADESDERVANEAADVVYHLMVGLALRDVPLRAVIEVLAKRFGTSGHEEKAQRRKENSTSQTE